MAAPASRMPGPMLLRRFFRLSLFFMGRSFPDIGKNSNGFSNVWKLDLRFEPDKQGVAGFEAAFELSVIGDLNQFAHARAGINAEFL